MIQLIVNRATGYVYYRGESISAAGSKWRAIKANMNASWYEHNMKDTVFDPRSRP